MTGVTKYLILGLIGAFASAAHGVITDDPICQCQTTECCNVDDSANTVFSGTTIVQLTYPDTSLTGSYTIVNQLVFNGTHDVNVTQDYQYVVKYVNEFKTAFDKNVFIFSDSDSLNCTEGALFYGDPASDYTEKIELLTVDVDGTSFCTLDIQSKLSDDFLADDSEVYFAFNRLVDENSDFNIMYDLSNEGSIVPIQDIKVFPYIITADTVIPVAEASGGEFFIDVSLNVSNVDVSVDGLDPSCNSIDDLFVGGNAYWSVPGGTDCPVEVTQSGVGDATDVAIGRNYHLKIGQEDYENCSIESRVSGGNLYFDFRLVLPTDDSETVEADEGCNYFAEPLNVQNITIIMAQDVTETVISEYVTDFTARVTTLDPVRCTDFDTYPTPHSKVKIYVNATFPSANILDFDTIGVPTFGETWESNTLLWDDSGAGTVPQYTCEQFVDPDGDLDNADDYSECEFRFVSSVCEPMYETDSGECAFERNTTRFVTDFSIEQFIVGGLSATYTAPPIDSGIDYSDFTADECSPQGERDIVDVTDLFDVSLDLRNYYTDEAVDWTNTSLLTMKDDMIARLEVGVNQVSPFEFSSDLSLMIKTVTVTLKNPITGETITSYVFSVTDKENFMDYSWTPYYRDPRFCTYYNSAATDKCESFFVNDTRSSSYHTNDWITTIAPQECQIDGTLVGEEDTNNADFFLFTPREWFRDNVQGYVQMEMKVQGTVHKCSDNARRALAGEVDDHGAMRGRELQSTPTAGRDVLYVSDLIIVTFVTDEDGSEHVEVIKPTDKGWFQENQVLVIVASVVAGIILVGLLFTWVQKRNGYRGIGSSTPFIVSASRPDF